MTTSPRMVLLFASITVGTAPAMVLAADHLTDFQLAAMYAGAGNGNGNGNVGNNNGNGNSGNNNGNGNVGNNSGNGNANDNNGNNDGSNKGNGNSALAGTSIATVMPAANTGTTPKTAAVSNVSSVRPMFSRLPLRLGAAKWRGPARGRPERHVAERHRYLMGRLFSAAVAIPSVR